MEGGTISNNEVIGIAGGSGGGIGYYHGDIIINDGTITGNAAKGTTNGGSGGAISSGIIHRNEAGKNGGGVYAYVDAISISGSTIRDNTAKECGGIFVGDFPYISIPMYAGNIEISNNSIARNKAGLNGGGVYVYDLHTQKTFTMTNINAIGNTAGIDGGGIAYNPDKITLDRITTNLITFQDNSAGSLYEWELAHPQTSDDKVNAQTHKDKILNTISFSKYPTNNFLPTHITITILCI